MARPLSPNQLQALDLLTLDGKSLAETAAELGVHLNTVWKWVHGINCVEFKAELDRRTEANVEVGRKRGQRRVGRAIEKFAEIGFEQWDKENSGQNAVRIKALEALLDRCGLPRVSKQVIDVDAARRELAAVAVPLSSLSSEDLAGAGGTEDRDRDALEGFLVSSDLDSAAETG